MISNTSDANRLCKDIIKNHYLLPFCQVFVKPAYFICGPYRLGQIVLLSVLHLSFFYNTCMPLTMLGLYDTNF